MEFSRKIKRILIFIVEELNQGKFNKYVQTFSGSVQREHCLIRNQEKRN